MFFWTVVSQWFEEVQKRPPVFNRGGLVLTNITWAKGLELMGFLYMNLENPAPCPVKPLTSSKFDLH